MCFLRLPPQNTEGLRHFGGANIISTVGPLFLAFGHLNKTRILEGCWGLLCVVSRRKLEAQTDPIMLMMLALGGCRALEERHKPQQTLKMRAVGSVCGCKPALHDKHAKGFACIAQTKPYYKLCMLHVV